MIRCNGVALATVLFDEVGGNYCKTVWSGKMLRDGIEFSDETSLFYRAGLNILIPGKLSKS